MPFHPDHRGEGDRLQTGEEDPGTTLPTFAQRAGQVDQAFLLTNAPSGAEEQLGPITITATPKMAVTTYPSPTSRA